MRRWVRYQAPVMVCVEMDDEDGDRVISVVIGDEDDDLQLIRDPTGNALVYDEDMQLLEPGDPTVDRALSEAEDRQWPAPADWECGPDALRYPGLYDPDDEPSDEDEAVTWPQSAPEPENRSSR